MLVEDGVVLGTGPHKYGSKNPIAKRLLKGFHSAVAELASSVNPRTILEIGCGEGYVTNTLLEATKAEIRSIDLADSIIDVARSNVTSPRVVFEKRSIYDLGPSDVADLVVCCEVLEHLDEPAGGLAKVLSVCRPHCILSVPREPLWRILNFVRGAYVRDFGNSPGHVQHWSRRSFLRFLPPELEVTSLRAPFPWTMVLGRRRASG